MEHASRVTLEEKLLDLLTSLDQRTQSLIEHGAETSRRLGEMERKLQEFLHFREKFLEWMGQYSRRLEEVRVFREESRASFESTFCKLEDLDQDVRLLKAAVRDVDRRYETLQKETLPTETTRGQSESA